MHKSIHRWLVALAAGFALAAPAAAHGPDAERGQWQRIDNPGPVIGMDGKPHEASCSGYPGTDPSYRFWVRHGHPKRVVVYFEGGGACWDDLTCTFPIAPGLPQQVPQFFVPQVPPGSPDDYPGLFDETRKDNPVQDWTIVYLPYCTGDLHLGSTDRTYNNFGHPVFPLPSQYRIRHRGYDNFMVVLDWMRKNLRRPDQVLTTGSSAGGYGASGNFPWIAEAYPRARHALLADASQGVTTTAFDAGTPGRGSWNAQLAPWVFGDDPLAVPGPDLVRQVARAYPRARVGQYTTNLDGVQIGFYGLMKQNYGPGGACPNPVSDWNQQMLATLSSYTGELRNFRSYVAPGSSHTILRSEAVYADTTVGVRFSEWLDEMLHRGHGRNRWDNAACPECLLPLPCF